MAGEEEVTEVWQKTSGRRSGRSLAEEVSHISLLTFVSTYLHSLDSYFEALYQRIYEIRSSEDRA